MEQIEQGIGTCRHESFIYDGGQTFSRPSEPDPASCDELDETHDTIAGSQLVLGRHR